MRILIIGEFSSFSRNLSKGFRLLGHECFVFSWGDGFKKIEQDGECYCIKQRDCKLPYPLRGVVIRAASYYSFLKLKRYVSEMSKKKKWDIIIIISVDFIKTISWDCYFTSEMVLSLIDNPENIYLSACGRDVPYHEYWKNKVWKNRPLINQGVQKFLSRNSIAHFEKCSLFIHKVIPVMYDYAEAWRNSLFARQYRIYETIPLPVDTSIFSPYNEICHKIVVFHGIIRPENKGTSYIVEAMNRLQNNYPDRVECIAKGGMPLKEYFKLLNRTNILIDQVYAGSSGMNALYALAMGKVLLGGNEPENAIEYKYSDIPIVNINNDVDVIYKKLEYLIIHPEEIKRLSKEGRRYVESVHDCKKVAQRYINIFINHD